MSDDLDERFRDVDEQLGRFDRDPTVELEPVEPPSESPMARGIAETIGRIGLPSYLEGFERARNSDREQRADEVLSTSRQIELLTGEMRSGFELLGKQLLPVVTRHDEIIRDHHKQLAEHRRLMFVISDRQNEIVGTQNLIVGKQTDIEGRLDVVERELGVRQAAKAAEPEPLPPPPPAPAPRRARTQPKRITRRK